MLMNNANYAEIEREDVLSIRFAFLHFEGEFNLRTTQNKSKRMQRRERHFFFEYFI